MLLKVLIGILVIMCCFTVTRAYAPVAYRAISMFAVARDLTVGMKNDYAKTVNIASHVFKRMDSHVGGGEYYCETPIIDDNFHNMYRRGFGFCDQSAHVFCALMNWAGLDAKILWLINDNGVSPHTVAIVNLDNDRQVVVDTHYKFIFPHGFRDNARFEKYLETVRAKNPNQLLYKQSWFENGITHDYFRKARRVGIWLSKNMD